MTKTQRRACFQRAKKQVIKSIKQAMDDERYDYIRNGSIKERPLQNRVEWDMDLFLREVRRIKFEDWVKI